MTTTCIRRPSATWTTCRCDTCTPHRARMAKLHRNGRGPRRRSDEAWAEVDRLLERGWTAAAIASAAHLPERTIRGAIEHRSTWSTVTAERILNRDPWPTTGHLPALGATRRLRALAAIGWSLAPLHARTGIPLMTLSHTRAGKSGRMTAAAHARIRAAYDTLHMTPGPSQQTRERAAVAGWAGPLAWDDIDDPAAIPDVGARAVGVDLDEWLRLVRWGERHDAAAARCGVTLGAIQQRAVRYGRADVLAVMRGEAA